MKKSVNWSNPNTEIVLWAVLNSDRLQNMVVQYLCGNCNGCFCRKATLGKCLIVVKMVFSVIYGLQRGSTAIPLCLFHRTESSVCSCNHTLDQFAQTSKCKRAQVMAAGFLADEGVQVSCWSSGKVQLNIVPSQQCGKPRQLLEERQE